MYNYHKVKPELFTHEGFDKLLRMSERAGFMIKHSGAVRLQELIKETMGESRFALACVDYLVEVHVLREIPQDDVAAQDRIFVQGSR